MSNTPANLAYGKRTIRMVVMNGVPKFAATDICNILGYVNPNKTLGRFCNSSPEYVRMDTAGGPQNVRMIGTEDIRAILSRSRHKAVRRLREWFETKVIPAVTFPAFSLVGVTVLIPFREVEAR
jgi:prophage antirepressor-like protein